MQSSATIRTLWDMRLMRFRTLLVLGGAVVVIASASAAAAQEVLGNYKDWTAFVDKTSGKKICYVGSKPKKSEGKYTQRGDIYVLVTHRPSENVVGEFNIETGYTYKSGSQPVVTIGGRTFKLFTKGSNAWAQNAKADKSLVSAMKAGSDMVVKATSSRGTLTTDTYSLSGFTAAYNAINKACL